MKAKYYLRGMGIGVFFTALIFGIALVFYKPKMSEEEIRREAAKLGMVNAVDEAVLGGEAETTVDADTGEKVTVEEIPALPDEEFLEGIPEDEASDTAEADETEADTEPSMEYQADQKDNTDEDSTSDSTSASASDSSSSASGNTGSSSSATGSTGSSTSATGNTGSTSSGNSASGSNTGSTASGNTGSSSNAGNNASNSRSSSGSSSSGSTNSGTAYGAGSSSGATKTLTIRTGENSYTTAAHLYKDGLVDNAGKFNTYLESNHYDVKIQAGTFTIPEGASYEEIVKIITRQR